MILNRGGGDCFIGDVKRNKELHVPDNLFFDFKHGKHGLFDILGRYKFTVEENTPIEQEVALDPELLGKVFEKFLLHLDQKETGSYYTPRIVVEYMVRESLVTYFSRRVDPQRGDLSKFHAERLRKLLSAEVDYESLLTHEKLSSPQAEQFVECSRELKTLDPAVGSGAFPMGILSQLTMALSRIDPENAILRQKNTEINKIFSAKNQLKDYGRKLFIIQNSIFGIDIQPMAVQICRLRFFISLAIEQEINDKNENYGILPLPNLEARIISADSLIGISKMDLFREQIKGKEKELFEIRREFFSAQTRDQKDEYKRKDDAKRSEIAAVLDEREYPAEDARRIANWDLYDQTKNADWFDPGVMFDVRDGFDIIIGNPPYGIFKKMNEKQKMYLKKLKKNFHFSIRGFVNTYRVFMEKAIMSLLGREGTISFIVPNTLLADLSADKIRQMLKKYMRLHFIIEFPEKSRVFKSAAQAVCIFLAEKCGPADDWKFNLTIGCKTEDLPPDEHVSLSWGQVRAISGENLTIPIIDNVEDYNLIKKLRQNAILLGQIVTVKEGDINQTVHREYMSCIETSHLLVRGVHTCRYCVDLSIENRELGWADLAKMKENLKPRKIQTIMTNISQQRIVCQRIINMGAKRRIIASVLPPNVIVGNTVNFMLLKTQKWELYAVLAILNSSLINWRFKATSTNNSVNNYELENLPFPKIGESSQRSLADLAKKITEAYETDLNKEKIPEWKRQIDDRVYGFYGLAPDEIALIESKASGEKGKRKC